MPVAWMTRAGFGRSSTFLLRMRNHGIKWTPRFRNTTSTHHEVALTPRPPAHPACHPSGTDDTIIITRANQLVPMVEAFLDAPMPGARSAREKQLRGIHVLNYRARSSCY